MYLPIDLFVCLSVCPSVRLSVCPSVGLSVCRSTSVYLSICLPIYPSVYLHICLSVYLSVGLFLDRSTDRHTNAYIHQEHWHHSRFQQSLESIPET